MPEADNIRRGDDARNDAYEVWYLTWNDPRTGQGFWLRHVTEPGRAELWFARFDPARPERTFGMHKRFDRIEARSEPFEIRIGGAVLANDHARGALAGAGHDVRWDLRWEPAAEPLLVQPALSYRFGIGTSRLVAPNPRVAMSGTVVVDGEPIPFEGALMGQSHVFGTKHLYTWAWAHCAELEGSEGALLELVTTRLYRRGFLLPTTCMVVLDLEGERHAFNQFRHFLGNEATWRTGEVKFVAWSPALKIEGELSCAPDALVQAEYEDPDGTRLYCSNTEIGDARLVVSRRTLRGWSEHRTLVSHGRAHFETGGRDKDPTVTREHVLV